MKLNEMKLGCFGIPQDEMSKLQTIFDSVEVIKFPLGKKYDLCYMDLSYVSSRVKNYIQNEDVIPLIVKDYFGHPSKKLPSLHEDSYLCLESCRDYAPSEFVALVKPYLDRFREKKVDYQLYKAIEDIKPITKTDVAAECAIPPMPSILHLEEDNSSKWKSEKQEIKSTRDVWETWKRRYDVIFED